MFFFVCGFSAFSWVNVTNATADSIERQYYQWQEHPTSASKFEEIAEYIIHVFCSSYRMYKVLARA